ncbi:MAG: hypothetical protein ACFCGT_25805 [Sandaracinaceae bacterium]
MEPQPAKARDGDAGAATLGAGPVWSARSREELTAFLVSAFSVHELRRLVRHHLPQLAADIRWTESLRTIAEDLVDLADRHRLDAALRDALLHEREGRREEVHALFASPPRRRGRGRPFRPGLGMIWLLILAVLAVLAAVFYRSL